MKRKSIIYSAVVIIIIVVAVIFIRSCNRKTGYIDPAFSEYISAFTSGRISVSSNIRIELTNEISSAELNLPVKERLFSFSPSIDGEAYWIDNRTIEFRPAKPMKQGTTYQVKFLLGKIMEVPGKLKTFIYSFETITQEASVEVSGYQPYIFTSLDWNTVEGKLLTADFADDMAIEEMVTATQEGKKLSIKWVHMSDSKEHKFVIDSVYRSEKASEVIISWEGKKIGAKTSGEEKVKIPSIFDFFVLDAKVEQEPEQYIAIRFSDPLNPKQNLEGLIHSETIAGFTFEISGMEIKAYPTTRQTGTANINVEQGILNIAGAKLKESHLFELVFESIKPAVRFACKGVILPDSKGLIVPFEAVNVKAVDLRIIKIYENNVGQFLQINQLDGAGELRRAGRLILKKTLRLGSEKPIIYNKWNSFSIDLSQLIKQEPGAIYRVQLSFKQSYSTYPCGSDKGEEENDDMTSFQDRDRDDFERESEQWDNPVNYYYEGDYEYYEGEYNWDERDNPCSASYFYGSERSVSKNVFASNIGIIAKGNSANFLTVAVSDLITAKPLGGAEIEVYNYQKQLIGKGNADNDGFCSINAKGKPFFILAKNGEQRGYLRVDDGSSLSLSNFDVSGEVIQKGLKGFIYGERGVWRPGDTVYLTFILEDKLSNIPDNHPVILEVINPLGKKVKRISKTNGENGFYTFIFSTLESDITGNYQANIKIGANLFTKTLKIETIKPNRLKINFNFESDILSESNQDATLNVKWLHGAPAKNMKAKVDVTLSSTTTSFKGFEGYVFNDPTKSFSTDEQTVFDGSIDDKGDAVIHSELSVGNSAPGMLRANFVTRVFEPGGDFSIDRINVLYSPYSVYVGVKCPEGEYRYVDTDTAQTFEIATVNSEGKPVNTENLEFKIYKLEWRWWWGSDNNDLANFTSSNYQSTVFSTHVNTVNGKGKVSFKLNYPNWGRYLVTVTDHTNGHSTGNIVYFDWPLWRGRADREDSKGVTMLTFNSDKHTYEVGNKATITVPTPANSRMLVSLETGSEILKAWWVNTDPKETRFSFDITENMTPNVYVNVSLIQPHTQVENDMPMRMYGVIPLLVENPGAKLMPIISMPDVLLPEQKATIKIKEKNNKPMTYTLAIVDDGLLDLTRFKTPDPYTAFNGKEALGIKTWDLYDLVMGAYGGKIEQLFSIGGDDALSGKDGAKAQRFKPVVKFLGPFTLKSGSNSHVVQLPAYIGSVRVMVIAGSKGTFGSAEKTVPVRKPLMVLATLPRVLGPGEEVDLPVTVFAMEKSVKKVSVEVVPNEFFTAIEGKSKSMEITELGEYTIPFRLKVNAKIGVGKVKVIASSGYEKAEYAIEIQIRNPNPRVVKYTESNCNASSGTNIGYELIGIAGTNKATLEVSSIPPIDLSRKIEYLLTYPYGCAEQTTSGAFPQIYVNKFIELSEYDKKRRDEHINYTIRYINSLMNSEGGIMYWPGDGSANDWVTSYTGHFMLEAEKAGYNLPSGFINNWLKYQKKNARSWTIDYNHYYQNDLVQAYRLFTLALAKEPEVGAMNRMKEIKNLSVSAAWRLAAAYVLIGQKDEALKLIQTVGKEIKEVERFNYTFGSAERDWAMMLETLCLLKDKTAAFPLAKKISAVLSGNNWVSTQTTAYCLLSMSRFLEIADVSNEIKFSYQLAGKSAIQVSTRLPVAKVSLPVDKEGTQTITLHNFTKGTLFMRVITEGVPETGPETGYENSLKMTIIYKNSSGGTVDVSRLSQGTDFAAEVTVKSLYPSVTITNLALSHVFPSGWEISNTRFLNENSEQQGYSNFTYQDFRDDRVNTFFDLPVNGYKTFTVKLTATYSGKFYLPGTLCEAMYEPGINAFMPGKWVEVVK